VSQPTGLNARVAVFWMCSLARMTLVFYDNTLCYADESVGFKFQKDEQIPEREFANYPGRIVPPMRNRYYTRKLGGVYEQE
jgi:hypothetical protein